MALTALTSRWNLRRNSKNTLRMRSVPLSVTLSPRLTSCSSHLTFVFICILFFSFEALDLFYKICSHSLLQHHLRFKKRPFNIVIALNAFRLEWVIGRAQAHMGLLVKHLWVIFDCPVLSASLFLQCSISVTNMCSVNNNATELTSMLPFLLDKPKLNSFKTIWFCNNKFSIDWSLSFLGTCSEPVNMFEPQAYRWFNFYPFNNLKKKCIMILAGFIHEIFFFIICFAFILRSICDLKLNRGSKHWKVKQQCRF